MAASFNTILIPVDFSDNTDVAVKKAVELADPDYCVIHLIYVLHLPVSAYISICSASFGCKIKSTHEGEIRKKLFNGRFLLKNLSQV
jgi:nucleotide-binding universal stress UspA family protein